MNASKVKGGGGGGKQIQGNDNNENCHMMNN